MIDIGYYSFIVSIILAVYVVFAASIGEKKESFALIESSRRSLYVISIFLTISSIVLLHALITRNFQVSYVANYTSRTLPMFYTVAAFWAGQEGSLLFWTWLLALSGAVVALDTKNKFTEKRYIPYSYAVIAFTEIFFLILMIFVTNPFELLNFIPMDGQGLNPLLQNPGMTWHPPTLFIGYAGYTIPFAYATGALISGEMDNSWVKDIRYWNIFTWFFLTLGIILGGQWAYEVLGWGGYWAWDPVENASFIPWLTGSAFMHSVMMQEKRGMFKTWNMLLAMITFNLCIFGTFITRTGIISSVHSFGKSNLGPFFTVFMLIVLIGFIILVKMRKDKLKSENELESFLSRENMFLFAIIILSVICFATLWGTAFPLISEIIKGVQITLGPTFFNKLTIPQFLILLALMGICPLIAWRKATSANLKKNFIIPGTMAIFTIISLYFLKINLLSADISFALCVFVLSVIIIEFYRGTKTFHNATGKNYIVSFFSIIWKNKRRYGGFIIHIGIVLLYFGITGSSAFVEEKEAILRKGDAVQLGQYKLRYDEMGYKDTPHKEIVTARISVFKNDKYMFTMLPEKNFYRNKEQPMTEVAIYSTLKHDLYIIFSGYDMNGTASFKFIINPLVFWIWIGTTVVFIGSVIAIFPEFKAQLKEIK
ncbi:MAG: heme lyase CcmF/NrfE family subunit [Candidatus Firestonebacteria bacterium]|nr:heme lyase CcmF/NrfE family subunit [Candidatus Firestonebacteria bacterium]